MNILLVMPNEADAQGILNAWQNMGLRCQPVYVRDPDESSAVLDHRKPYEREPDPDIVIVSSHLDQARVRELYAHKAGCFIDTPADLGEYLRHIESGSSLHVRVVILPSLERPRRFA